MPPIPQTALGPDEACSYSTDRDAISAVARSLETDERTAVLHALRLGVAEVTARVAGGETIADLDGEATGTRQLGGGNRGLALASFNHTRPALDAAAGALGVSVGRVVAHAVRLGLVVLASRIAAGERLWQIEREVAAELAG